jgi:hypothetical protein
MTDWEIVCRSDDGARDGRFTAKWLKAIAQGFGAAAHPGFRVNEPTFTPKALHGCDVKTTLFNAVGVTDRD